MRLTGRAVTREETLLGSAIEAIGSTPLVSLARLAAGYEGMLLAKLEFLNPGLSKKDPHRGRSSPTPNAPRFQAWPFVGN
jgi:hypothetical protein